MLYLIDLDLQFHFLFQNVFFYETELFLFQLHHPVYIKLDHRWCLFRETRLLLASTAHTGSIWGVSKRSVVGSVCGTCNRRILGLAVGISRDHRQNFLKVNAAVNYRYSQCHSL